MGNTWFIVMGIHVQVLSYGVKKNPIMLLAILQFLFASIVLIIFGFYFLQKNYLIFQIFL